MRIGMPLLVAWLIVVLSWTAAAQDGTAAGFVFTPEAVERTPPSCTLQQALKL